ncbi:hypothetical protein KSP40_PGU010338 [Platanthera guangdongensis]|uniref:Secreted protein n=1 Tax=Platanthera guangdongensis TaxID=2320717 RepID=A0ABR2LHL0_9ASPA
MWRSWNFYAASYLALCATALNHIDEFLLPKGVQGGKNACCERYEAGKVVPFFQASPLQGPHGT